MVTPVPPRRIAVIGLGYAGLPVAVAFASKFESVVGFDIDGIRLRELASGHDRTGEVSADALEAAQIHWTSRSEDLESSDFFVITVPTPIDAHRRPDLGPLELASRVVGTALRRGAIVVYESTVYPGLTETSCGPWIESTSGLRCGVDFKLGYSPERINPGDSEHRFETIDKVVSAQDAETLEVIAEVYGAVVRAPIHRVSSIAVAEAAKVIENTQRDLNIALMNELAIVCDRLGIDTLDVLAAAGTKWNFLPFRPGLVGGHCIGVDPYYLTARAEQLGVHPQVILAGRRINDGMGQFIAEKTVKELIRAGLTIQQTTVGVVGLTFKENVPDIRNSQVPSVIAGLREYGVRVRIHEPLAKDDAVREAFGLTLEPLEALRGADALILAVPHRGLLEAVQAWIESEAPAVVVDVKGALDRSRIPPATRYWRL